MTVTSTKFLLSTANLRICVTFYSQPKMRPASVLEGETTLSCFIAPVKTVHLWSQGPVSLSSEFTLTTLGVVVDFQGNSEVGGQVLPI